MGKSVGRMQRYRRRWFRRLRLPFSLAILHGRTVVALMANYPSDPGGHPLPRLPFSRHLLPLHDPITLAAPNGWLVRPQQRSHRPRSKPGCISRMSLPPFVDLRHTVGTYPMPGAICGPCWTRRWRARSVLVSPVYWYSFLKTYLDPLERVAAGAEAWASRMRWRRSACM